MSYEMSDGIFVENLQYLSISKISSYQKYGGPPCPFYSTDYQNGLFSNLQSCVLEAGANWTHIQGFNYCNDIHRSTFQIIYNKQFLDVFYESESLSHMFIFSCMNFSSGSIEITFCPKNLLTLQVSTRLQVKPLFKSLF